MDESSTSALQYGHLGKATYIQGNNSWVFSRTLNRPSLISYTGITKTSVTSPLTAPQFSLVENKNLLPKAYPELAASWSLIRNETYSHVVTNTSETCDPQISTLLDLGNAVDSENVDASSRTVPIAAFASGECGNSISFRRLEEDTIELKHQSTWMRVPAIGEAEVTEWPADGAPVRQICFARTVEGKATWMAARFPDSTILFRPAYNRDPVSIQVYRDKERMLSNIPPNSRLDANPLVEISNIRTGGFAHADVTFNPWYQRQFAIVDERGNWSIWDISGQHRRNKANWAATCVKSGSLPWFDTGDNFDLDDKPCHDGWAVVEWVGDVNTLVVSDRRCPMLYRMESDQVWPIPIELGLKRKSEWILDIKRSMSNVSHVFILTTTRIFWLELTSNLDSPGDEYTESSLYPRLSWRHYRDPEDTTLRLSSLLTKEDHYVFLYSRLNHFVLGYQCPNAVDGHGTVSIPDPFILDVPSMVDVPAESQISPNGAQFSTLVFKEIAHSPTSVGKVYYDSRARLAKLFLLDSRLAIRESVYTGPAVDGDTIGNFEERSLGRDALRVKKRQQPFRRSKARRFWNDFIVDDWDESILGMGASTVAGTGFSAVTPRAIPQWTTDYTNVYAVATGKLFDEPGDETGQYSEAHIKATISTLEDKLDSATLNEPTSGTLLEALGTSPLLDDIDQSARAIDDIVSLCGRRLSTAQSGHLISILAPDLAISPLVDPATAQESNRELSLVRIYDRLVNDWLSYLPHHIPGRTRIMKEEVIRKLAADLTLALINIIRKSAAQGNEARSNEEVEHQNGSLPAPSINSHGATAPRRSSLSASQSDGDGLTSDRVPLYSSLSRLTTFKSQPSISRNVENVLAHWVPGADPASYDWQKTVQSITDDESQQTSRATTPSRRIRKKTPQTAPISSPAPPPISPAVPIIREDGSQPVGSDVRRGIPQSSQVTAMEEDRPMTQVERGAFGGREASKRTAMKSRKKKRAAGF